MLWSSLLHQKVNYVFPGLGGRGFVVCVAAVHQKQPQYDVKL